jgi:hypothetical protein
VQGAVRPKFLERHRIRSGRDGRESESEIAVSSYCQEKQRGDEADDDALPNSHLFVPPCQNDCTGPG